MIFRKQILHRDDLNLDGRNFVERRAARAVILRDGKILLMHLRGRDEYKFPGGGTEPGEDWRSALARELKEEAGAVVTGIAGKLGEVVEYNRRDDDAIDYFKMVSEYFEVSIEEGLEAQDLDPWEEDLEFSPVWMRIEDALERNRGNMLAAGEGRSPWIERETYVLGELAGRYVAGAPVEK